MDLLGYAALGGLERLTIVAGAVIIGYWGYRLYTAEKNAGLVFMGLAVLVLVGALATGGSYLKSVGEGYQLASLPVEAPTQDSPFADDGNETDTMESAQSDPARAPVAELAADEAPAAAVQPASEADAEAPEAIAPPAAEPAIAAAPETAVAETSALETEGSPVRLATGAELGGRIVSVKSENVSLEWVPEPAESNGSE